jgi:hypothetical protein
MKRLVPAVALAAALAGCNAMAPAAAPSAMPQRMLGSWTLVSVTAGSAQPYGPAPQGLMSIGADGRYGIQIYRPGTPKFAVNDRTKGTDAENRAVIANGIAYFGSYRWNERERALDIHIDQCTFPNYTGQDQKRFVQFVDDDTVHMTNAASSTGAQAVIVWKRAGR